MRTLMVANRGEIALRVIRAWEPARLRLTHFGAEEDVDSQLELVGERLRELAELARPGDRERFLADLQARVDAELDEETARRLRQAVPPEQSWLGLERYWRLRGDREGPLQRGQ